MTLHVGQSVPWPTAPDGVAQVEELLRSNVGLLYLRRGRLCRARVAAGRIARLIQLAPLLIQQDNLLQRAIVRKRQKSFELNDRTGSFRGNNLRKVRA